MSTHDCGGFWAASAERLNAALGELAVGLDPGWLVETGAPVVVEALEGAAGDLRRALGEATHDSAEHSAATHGRGDTGLDLLPPALALAAALLADRADPPGRHSASEDGWLAGADVSTRAIAERTLASVTQALGTSPTR